MYIFKRTCLKALSNFNFYTKSLFLSTFFTAFDMFLIKLVNLNINNRSGKKKKLCRCFFSTLSGITGITIVYSQLQHVYYKVLSFFYKFLNYCFRIFENLTDICIFLDFLLLMIGGLFKCLFLSFFSFISILVFHSNGYFW